MSLLTSQGHRGWELIGLGLHTGGGVVVIMPAMKSATVSSLDHIVSHHIDDLHWFTSLLLLSLEDAKKHGVQMFSCRI